MTYSTMTRVALIGSAVAALVAVGLAAPAWAQAKIYPQGTDCSAIQSPTDRLDCMNKLLGHQEDSTTGSGVGPQADQNNGIGSGNQLVPPANAPTNSGTSNSPSGVNSNTTGGSGTTN